MTSGMRSRKWTCGGESGSLLFPVYFRICRMQVSVPARPLRGGPIDKGNAL